MSWTFDVLVVVAAAAAAEVQYYLSYLQQPHSTKGRTFLNFLEATRAHFSN